MSMDFKAQAQASRASRVKALCGGGMPRATGGSVSAAPARAKGGKVTCRASGGAVPGRAKGGRLDKRRHGNVNIAIVSPHGGAGASPMGMPPMAGPPMPGGLPPGGPMPMPPGAAVPQKPMLPPSAGGAPGRVMNRGGAVSSFKKGGRVKHRADGGDVYDDSVGYGGKAPADTSDIPVKKSDTSNLSDVESDQQASRTGEDTENVGMKYPKGPPSKTSSTTTASAKSATPLPRARPQMAASSTQGTSGRAKKYINGSTSDSTGAGSTGYNQNLTSSYKRGGAAKKKK